MALKPVTILFLLHEQACAPHVPEASNLFFTTSHDTSMQHFLSKLHWGLGSYELVKNVKPKMCTFHFRITETFNEINPLRCI